MRAVAAMAKTVEKNHKVVSEENDSNFEFEDMIEGIKTEAPDDEAESTSETENTVDDENSADKGKKKTASKKKGSGKSENVIVLKKAATYSGCGLKFNKNEPTSVEDETIYNKLLSTGLFEEV